MTPQALNVTIACLRVELAAGKVSNIPAKVVDVDGTAQGVATQLVFCTKSVDDLDAAAITALL
jgi:hypothetical protein